MSQAKSVALFFSLIFTVICLAQTPNSKNPLLIHSNAPIEFEKTNAKVVREAVSQLINVSDERVDKIISATKNSVIRFNTLASFDELQYNIIDLSSKLQMISVTYVSDSTRDAANKGSEMLSQYASNLFLNEKLYKAVKQYASSSAAQQLHANQKK